MLTPDNSTPARVTGRRTVKAMINGEWHPALEETAAVRQAIAGGGFHDRVSAAGDTGWPAVPGRYHLYVSYACPWAHRTIIYRKLKCLDEVVSMSVLQPRWAGPNGWSFEPSGAEREGGASTVDHVANRRHLFDVYRAARPDFTGRVTVPVFWDRERGTIVNNESGEIIRMLNSQFDAWGDPTVDFYPKHLRTEIDAFNGWLLPKVCQNVYKAGFSRTQEHYDRAVQSLFSGLDELELRLSRNSFVLGERITECDWHLFATLARFDAAYYGALKCNLCRLIDYPALSAYARRLHAVPGVAETVRMDHIKEHYFDAIGEIDPTIVPAGPVKDYRTDFYTRDNASRGDPVSTSAIGNTEDFVAEVRDLHEFLERWLKGAVQRGDEGPARLQDALADDFVVVHPDGRREGKTQILGNFAAAYGAKPAGYRLQISDISPRVLDEHLCLVSYEERHDGGHGRARMSAALLRRRADARKIDWLFLQETPVA